jgi:hypothetical protein
VARQVHPLEFLKQPELESIQRYRIRTCVADQRLDRMSDGELTMPVTHVPRLVGCLLSVIREDQ